MASERDQHRRRAFVQVMEALIDHAFGVTRTMEIEQCSDDRRAHVSEMRATPVPALPAGHGFSIPGVCAIRAARWSTSNLTRATPARSGTISMFSGTGGGENSGSTTTTLLAARRS
jgi:hypothetical protein